MVETGCEKPVNEKQCMSSMEKESNNSEQIIIHSVDCLGKQETGIKMVPKPFDFVNSINITTPESPLDSVHKENITKFPNTFGRVYAGNLPKNYNASCAITRVDVVIHTLFIEPKFHFQTIGHHSNCVLRVLQKTYNDATLAFTDSDNKRVIHAAHSKDVNRCKRDFDLCMTLRCWWEKLSSNTDSDIIYSDEEDSLSNKKGLTVIDSNFFNCSDIRLTEDVLQNKKLITVVTFGAAHQVIACVSVVIEQMYKFQAIGHNVCVLRALRITYKVSIGFCNVNNNILIHGIQQNVILCKADVDLNMSVRRWWDETHVEKRYVTQELTESNGEKEENQEIEEAFSEEEVRVIGETHVKTWAEEVDEAYPVPDECLQYFPSDNSRWRNIFIQEETS